MHRLVLLEQAIINLTHLHEGVLPGCPEVPKDVVGLVQGVLVQVWVLLHGIVQQATLVRVQVLGHDLVDMVELLGGGLVPDPEQLVVLVCPLDLGTPEQVLVHQGTMAAQAAMDNKAPGGWAPGTTRQTR